MKRSIRNLVSVMMTDTLEAPVIDIAVALGAAPTKASSTSQFLSLGVQAH
jgi:hypothetical protein